MVEDASSEREPRENTQAIGVFGPLCGRISFHAVLLSLLLLGSWGVFQLFRRTEKEDLLRRQAKERMIYSSRWTKDETKMNSAIFSTQFRLLNRSALTHHDSAAVTVVSRNSTQHQELDVHFPHVDEVHELRRRVETVESGLDHAHGVATFVAPGEEDEDFFSRNDVASFLETSGRADVLIEDDKDIKGNRVPISRASDAARIGNGGEEQMLAKVADRWSADASTVQPWSAGVSTDRSGWNTGPTGHRIGIFDGAGDVLSIRALHGSHGEPGHVDEHAGTMNAEKGKPGGDTDHRSYMGKSEGMIKEFFKDIEGIGLASRCILHALLYPPFAFVHV